jgi:integrase
MRKRLTKQVLGALARGDLVFDTATPGFFAEAQAKGVALRVKADLRINGAPKTRKSTLGRWPDMSIEVARPLALEWLAKVKRGVDPSAPVVAAGLERSVSEAYRDYERGAVKKRGEAARRHCQLMQERLARYCPDWLDRPLASITPQEARDRHDQIMAAVVARGRIEGADGARSANQALRDLRAVWNRTAKVVRELPPCPVAAVEWAPERNDHHIIEWSDMPAWLDATLKLSNPLRRTMHHFGLFSGLRPGTLVALERSWVDLKNHAVHVPKSAMKGQRDFDMPMSPALEKLLSEALALSAAWFPEARWIFPTRSAKGELVPTRAWKERTMPGWTGHALRHTYSAAVILAGVSEVSRELLLSHKLPGIRGRYVDDHALWTQLLADQARVSAKILQLIHDAS